MIKSILFTIITTQLIFTADDLTMTRQKVSEIDAIEGLCRAAIRFDPGNPKQMYIPSYQNPQERCVMSVQDFQNNILSALIEIKRITSTSANKYLSFIESSSFIKNTESIDTPENSKLIDIMKTNIDHRLSFAYFQLHLLQTNTTNNTLQKCQQTVTAIAKKKGSEIRMIWREDTSNPVVSIDAREFDAKFETYCKHSIPSLGEKIKANRYLAAQKQRDEQIAQRKKAQEESWCSIS